MSENSLIVWDQGKYNFQKKLGNFVQCFQVGLQKNGNGIPMELIDPTVIAQGLLSAETTDDIPQALLEQATLVVEFMEGFPTVEGTPIWERLDGEQIPYYKLFKEYRDMKYIGGARAIAKVAETNNIAGKYLNGLAKIYHWQMRCKAYDQYKDSCREAERSFEIQKMEAKHAQAANNMLQQGLQYLDKHPEQMNPKFAIQLVQMAMKAERLSLGLNGDKPGSSTGGNQSSTNINIQQSSNVNNGSQLSVVEAKVKEQNEDSSHLQSILHVLDQAGAFTADAAQKTTEVIEVESEEVE